MSDQPITARQESYMRSLLDSQEIPEKDGVSGEDRRANALRLLDEGRITKRQAMKTISWLIDLPKKRNNPANPVGRIRVEYKELELDDGKTHRVGAVIGAGRPVLRGRYAVETPGELWVNDLTFVQVWVGKRGGWKLYMQASDDLGEVADWAKKRLLIEKIAADPEAASRRYGKELGKCGVCGRTLTNDLSRELGIGPVCRSRLVDWTGEPEATHGPEPEAVGEVQEQLAIEATAETPGSTRYPF